MNEQPKVKKSVVDGKEFSTNEDFMTIKQIMNEFNLTHVYVSRAVQKGWLSPVEKVKLNNKGNQFKYVVKRTVVEQWRKRCESKSRRTDGRRKFNFYMTQDEYNDFMKVKKEHFPETEIKLANPSKS